MRTRHSRFAIATLLGLSLLYCPGAFAREAGAVKPVIRKAPATEPVAEDAWTELFDGKTFNGWKLSTENPKTFTIKDGAIVANGPRAHLFYAGDVGNHNFRNFELKIDVMTRRGSNGGVYFHTKYQERGWPGKGFEVQVNNTHKDRRKSGGLYGVRDVTKAPAGDDEWFTEHIIVRGKRIIVKVNGKTLVDFTEPTPPRPPSPGRVLSSGTFALQGHDPGSTVYYKNIRVKVLPDDAGAEGAEPAGGNVYLFTSFRGNGRDGLHLAFSRDGIKWTALKGDKSFLRPAVGSKLMRDPCVLRGPDGTFHMVWTTGWHDKCIGIAHSPDLIEWSPQKALPVMAGEDGAWNCWAPEIFYDDVKKQYLIFWATTIKGRFPETAKGGDHNHRMYYVATKDFKAYTKAKLFYDDGFNVIDATIVKDGKRYVMFLKDERRRPVKKNIRIAFAEAADGPYGKASEPIAVVRPTKAADPKARPQVIDWVEGPTAIKIGDEWFVYFDEYTRHRYGAVRSKDLKHWKRVEGLKFPRGMRHGTILEVSQAVISKLKAQQ